MAQPKVSSAGGLAALTYVFKKAREAGGLVPLWNRLRRRNACKTCALGMGGSHGGMVNEAGHFPEVCKKSVQAQAGDMGRTIPESLFASTSIEDLARLTSAEFERLGRLAFPVVAGPGDTHFRRCTWEDALDDLTKSLGGTDPLRTFFYASGRSSNEAAFLLQLVARAYGSPNIHNCSFYCHAASGVALSEVYGSGTASVVLDDLEHADFVLLAGANPASNHPRLITQLVKLRRRGGRVLTINPLRELGLEHFRVPSDTRSFLFGSQVTDLYLQPHAGGDAALFVALLKRVIERGGVDRTFVDRYTSGFQDVEAHIQQQSWEDLERESGVPKDKVNEAVELLLQAERGIFCWAMGLTHHEHGVQNILALSNLALARGFLGRPGTGLLPIRGHSNVQGVGSVGVSPELKEAFASKLEGLFGITVPRTPGQDTFASMEAAERGEVDVGLLLGGNLFASNPDRDWAGRALRTIPLTVSLTTKLNEGHVHGRGQTSYVLPVLARDEEPQLTTQESMFNYVRVSEGGPPAVSGEMRSEVEIVSSVAERLLPEGRVDWSALRSHHELRTAIAHVVPGYEALDDEGTGTPREFQIPGRTFHEPRFATPDQKARFRVTSIPKFDLAPDEFRLITLRSEGQFNTVVYDEEDLYRGNTTRDVVMMSKCDAERLEVRENDIVRVSTPVGRMIVKVAIVDVRDGTIAMYYPEANVLVPGKLDPASKTPAFKSVAARVERVR